jgi:hypothetical protein
MRFETSIFRLLTGTNNLSEMFLHETIRINPDLQHNAGVFGIDFLDDIGHPLQGFLLSNFTLPPHIFKTVAAHASCSVEAVLVEDL